MKKGDKIYFLKDNEVVEDTITEVENMILRYLVSTEKGHYLYHFKVFLDKATCLKENIKTVTKEMNELSARLSMLKELLDKESSK